MIATDPIAYLRPQAAQAYIAEIRKITNAPIKYVVYSHHHYDHAAGGRPFKELGATFIAHRNAKAHALDWERMIPGHPQAGSRLGTREDVRNLIQYTNDLSDAVKAAAEQGKCFDQAIAEVKLPKQEKWGSYAQYLPGNIQRFCEYWGRGY